MKLAGFRHLLLIAFVPLLALCFARSAFAQPAPLAPPQLDQLVARIALYPDPLLAQILTASTYWTEIPEAAAWADQHSYLRGDALAEAMEADHLQWDPSVLALLPFPSVLDMMARDMEWTEQLGNAVLTQRADVMEAIQRMRRTGDELWVPGAKQLRERCLGRRIYPDPARESERDLFALLRSPGGLRPAAAGDCHWRRHPLWPCGDHRSRIRRLGMVAWFGIRVAFPRHPHRSPAMG